jgi:hypothetical protein
MKAIAFALFLLVGCEPCELPPEGATADAGLSPGDADTNSCWAPCPLVPGAETPCVPRAVCRYDPCSSVDMVGPWGAHPWGCF